MFYCIKQEIQVTAWESLSICAQHYAEDSNEEIHEYVETFQSFKDHANNYHALPFPFQRRPDLATRLYIRRNTRRSLPALMNELTNWTWNTRLLSAKLLLLLITFYEDSLVDDLPVVLPALQRALAYESKRKEDELRVILSQCLNLIQSFTASSVSLLPPIEQRFKGLDIFPRPSY